MEPERTRGKGIRGWSVSQEMVSRRARAVGPSFLEAIGSRRGFLARAVVVVLALWAGGGLILGEKGVVRLHAQHQEEAALRAEQLQLQQRLKEADFEHHEDPGLNMERVMRERYRKSLPGEIVFDKLTVPPDSTAASSDTKSPEMGR
jgi:cell division protein FtsB